MYDRKAGRNKGFGYVRFHDPSVIRDILLIRPHVIDGKAVDVKECLPRSVTDVRNIQYLYCNFGRS